MRIVPLRLALLAAFVGLVALGAIPATAASRDWMHLRVKQVELWAGPDVAKGLPDEARRYRLKNNTAHTRNVVVARIVNPDKTIRIVVVENIAMRAHSERVLVDMLRAEGVELASVTDIYSELEPCDNPGRNCRRMLYREFGTNVTVYYSFMYRHILRPGEVAKAIMAEQRHVNAKMLATRSEQLQAEHRARQDGSGAPAPGRASGQGAAAADPVDATREAIGAAGASSRAGERGAGGTDGAGATPGVMGTEGMTSATPGLDGETGGIDFSSLELRYVSDVSTDKTRAAGFAFKALPGKGTADRGAGARAAQRASEAFFVFLALDPRTFTVNLQPGQVDRIVDGKLGRTNAGRVMLEADLRMKKAVAPLIHPDGRVGRRYWSEINRIVGTKRTCFIFRQWIVPAEATVYESEGELYILKAPLSVQLEADYYRSRSTPPLLNRCGGVDPAVQRRIEAVYRRLILSRVQRAVRRAPEFAALRRVYFSRIAAEWYRERAAARAGGAYADIVGSGDIAPWAPARSWTPRDVFDRYMRSATEGEFNVKRRVRIGQLRQYAYGGVLFSDVPRRNVSRAELTAMRPGLARRIAGALSQPAVDPQSGEIWLAGASFDRTAAASDPAFGSRGSADDGPDIGAPLVAFLVALGSALLVLVTRRVMRRPG